MEPILKHGINNVNIQFREAIETLLKELRKLLRENLISVVLFGSVAREDFKEDSDIDLLIVAKELPHEYSTRIDLFIPIVEEVRKKIPKNPFIQIYPLSVEEASKNRPIYLDMLTDAIILYDEDEFMANVLKRLWEKLVKLGAKKIKLEDGSWAWILKPNIKVGEVIEI
jgi:predicted nucleotidyltransferase